MAISKASRGSILVQKAWHLRPTASSTCSTGTASIMTGAWDLGKQDICRTICSPLGAVISHSPRPVPRSSTSHSGNSSASSARLSRRSTCRPSGRSAASTTSAAASTPSSRGLNTSRSSVRRSTMPCSISAVPPATANPYLAATGKTMCATSRANGLTGTGSSGAGSRARDDRATLPAGLRAGPQLRVLVFPRQPDAFGQPQPDLWPYADQEVCVQIDHKVVRPRSLAQHSLIQPCALVSITEVEAAVTAGPEQPHRQLNRAGTRAAQQLEPRGDERAAPGPGLVPAPGRGWLRGCHVTRIAPAPGMRKHVLSDGAVTHSAGSGLRGVRASV